MFVNWEEKTFHFHCSFYWFKCGRVNWRQMVQVCCFVILNLKNFFLFCQRSWCSSWIYSIFLNSIILFCFVFSFINFRDRKTVTLHSKVKMDLLCFTILFYFFLLFLLVCNCYFTSDQWSMTKLNRLNWKNHFKLLLLLFFLLFVCLLVKVRIKFSSVSI